MHVQLVHLAPCLPRLPPLAAAAQAQLQCGDRALPPAACMDARHSWVAWPHGPSNCMPGMPATATKVRGHPPDWHPRVGPQERQVHLPVCHRLGRRIPLEPAVQRYSYPAVRRRQSRARSSRDGEVRKRTQTACHQCSAEPPVSSGGMKQYPGQSTATVAKAALPPATRAVRLGRASSPHEGV